MLRFTLGIFGTLWKRLLLRQLALAEKAAHRLDVKDNLARLLSPPVPVSRAATARQEVDFIRWRSPTYVGPMSDGVVSETVDALLGRNKPEPFDAKTIIGMAFVSPLAYMLQRDGDEWVIDYGKLALYPFRAVTIAQFRFSEDGSQMSIIDIGGVTHRPGDLTWETAVTHLMCWTGIVVPSAAHNWVHFALPDTIASVHDRLTKPDSVLGRLLAPHVRFTNRINYQALWIQRSSNNAPTFQKKLIPWMSAPFQADQFRGGILRNTQAHYRDMPRHFELPKLLDSRIPYFVFLRAYYEVIERFIAALDPHIEDDVWQEFSAAVDREMPGFAAIPRVKALAVFIWQAGVVHIVDHLTFFDAAIKHAFSYVPATLSQPYTASHVSRWDRWRTRNFLKTFVTFNPHPELDQRLTNVESYGFTGGSVPHAAATLFREELLTLDKQLASQGIPVLALDRMVQSVCF